MSNILHWWSCRGFTKDNPESIQHDSNTGKQTFRGLKTRSGPHKRALPRRKVAFISVCTSLPKSHSGPTFGHLNDHSAVFKSASEC